MSNEKNELKQPDKQSVGGVSAEISDPSVTRLDMHLYGYKWDGMIPLNKERALEAFDSREVYLLYEDGTESAAESRDKILAFDGLFGIENEDWIQSKRDVQLDVFIVNSRRPGEIAGEWLKLPAKSEDLQGVFERLKISGHDAGAFSVAELRAKPDLVAEHIKKSDSLDELNMLASYLAGMEDYEISKLEAILEVNVWEVEKGAAGLFNLLDPDNFGAFDMIAASNAAELWRYWAEESPGSLPDNVRYEDFGAFLAREQNGAFTDSDYICFKYDELLTCCRGDVPPEYRILSDALRACREKSEHALSIGNAFPLISEPKFTAWQSVVETTPGRWREDIRFSRAGDGAMYCIGGEQGMFLRVQKDGRVNIGTYEGNTLTHGGYYQAKTYELAVMLAARLGGERFIADIFQESEHAYERNQSLQTGEKRGGVSQSDISPVYASVLEKINESRKAPITPKTPRKGSQEHSKNKDATAGDRKREDEL